MKSDFEPDLFQFSNRFLTSGFHSVLRTFRSTSGLLVAGCRKDSDFGKDSQVPQVPMPGMVVDTTDPVVDRHTDPAIDRHTDPAIDRHTNLADDIHLDADIQPIPTGTMERRLVLDSTHRTDSAHGSPGHAAD